MTAPSGPTSGATAPGEQAGAAVQVEHRVARRGRQGREDGLAERVGGGRVDLPEPAGADLPEAARGALGEVGRCPRRGCAAAGACCGRPPRRCTALPPGPGAGPAAPAGRPAMTVTAKFSVLSAPPTATSTVVAPLQSSPGMSRSRTAWWAIRQSPMSTTSCERCSRRPGHAVAADRELDPGAPAEPGGLAGAAVPVVAGQRLDGDLAVDAGQPPQLLRDHRGLERALGGRGRRAASRSRRSRRGGRAGTARPPGPVTARRTRTASARANLDVTSVTRATTRSPGSACRTNITGGRPAGRRTSRPARRPRWSPRRPGPRVYESAAAAARVTTPPTAPGRLRAPTGSLCLRHEIRHQILLRRGVAFSHVRA